MAYLDDEPVGWVAVEPRTAYPKLRTSRIPWTGRDEDKDDEGIWAVTCLVVRKGYRGRGLTYPLARATIDYANERGARALEAYPMITQPGKEITWGEMHVGAARSSPTPGSRRSAAPPSGGWSCGSTLSRLECATKAAGRQGEPTRGTPSCSYFVAWRQRHALLTQFNRAA